MVVLVGFLKLLSFIIYFILMVTRPILSPVLSAITGFSFLFGVVLLLVDVEKYIYIDGIGSWKVIAIAFAYSIGSFALSYLLDYLIITLSPDNIDVILFD